MKKLPYHAAQQTQQGAAIRLSADDKDPVLAPGHALFVVQIAPRREL